MKRIFFIVLFFSLVFSLSFSCAEISLSDISYDDLLDLQKDLVKEIMSRPEWKEVQVPAGQWRVGEDIPAGNYSISTTHSMCHITVWESEVGDVMFGQTFGALYDDYVSEGFPIGKITLNEGNLVVLKYDCMFSPPQSLGF